MKPLQIAGLVFVILALISFISQTGPMWGRVVVLLLGLGSLAYDYFGKK